jgi:hypothetical protein
LSCCTRRSSGSGSAKRCAGHSTPT